MKNYHTISAPNVTAATSTTIQISEKQRPSAHNLETSSNSTSFYRKYLGLGICLFVFACIHLQNLVNGGRIVSPSKAPEPTQRTEVGIANSHVSVDIFVMSKCPDAQLVEREFDTIVWEVGQIIDIRLVYIGKPNDNSTFGVECKHGDSECKGNIDQLCAYNTHLDDQEKWWSFVSCLNLRPYRIGTDDKWTLKCATRTGLELDSWNSCRNGDKGKKLLGESVLESEKRGIQTSATILIDNKLRCVEDSGWRECPGGHSVEDFERDICHLYGDKSTAPPVCARF